jgi:hypothetical protein
MRQRGVLVRVKRGHAAAWRYPLLVSALCLIVSLACNRRQAGDAGSDESGEGSTTMAGVNECGPADWDYASESCEHCSNLKCCDRQLSCEFQNDPQCECVLECTRRVELPYPECQWECLEEGEPLSPLAKVLADCMFHQCGSCEPDSGATGTGEESDGGSASSSDSSGSTTGSECGMAECEPDTWMDLCGDPNHCGACNFACCPTCWCDDGKCSTP